VTRVDVGGKLLSERMGDMLHDRGFILSSNSDLETLRRIKEKHCYVAFEFERENQRAADPSLQRFINLNGRTVIIATERFRCPEALFTPSLVGVNSPGIHEQTVAAIRKCDPAIAPDLFRNIVLSGGSSLFPGLPERLQKEVLTRAPPATTVTIVASPGRQFAAWIGGSVASMKKAEGTWISRKDYRAFGPAIVHRRCS
jgi:actin-related protein